MQICSMHWWLMKEAVHTRGLWPLVAQGADQVIHRITEELKGTEDDSTYDPLMAATHMINGQALKMGGLYLMTDDYCPLCEVNKYLGVNQDVEWIKGCMDSVLQYCREHNIVPATTPERLTQVRYEVEKLDASEQQTKVAVMLGDLAAFIEQDESIKFELQHKPKGE